MSEIWIICPTCGGVLGRDCFNPEECAFIAQQKKEDLERKQENDEENFKEQEK